MINNRTFEIISKWVGKQYNITIKFCDISCPRVDINSKVIELPNWISEENAIAAVAQVMHEAAHIRWTPRDLEKMNLNNFQQSILNAIEDIRIDQHNFGTLPNVHEFYREMMKGIENDGSDNIFPVKVMCDMIYQLEQFPEFRLKDKDVDDFVEKHKIKNKTQEIINHIEDKEFKEAKDKLLKLCKLLKDEFEDRKAKGKEPDGASLDETQGGKEGTGETAGDEEESLSKQIESGVKNMKKMFKGCGTGLGKGEDLGQISPLALEEQTKKKFTELLNVKEVKKVYEEQGKLDTERISAYFTGDIDDLFSEPQIVKKKKSKILLLLDSSGSMTSTFPYSDGRCDKTVIATCKTVIEILEEVKALEGFNIEWEVACFDSYYHELRQEGWDKDYQGHLGGGTDLGNAFEKAVIKLAMDQEIDGNRIIIALTDGEVDSRQVGQVKSVVNRHSGDVKCMIIGVGCNPIGEFVKEIGAANIISEDTAEQVLMESIMNMIEG